MKSYPPLVAVHKSLQQSVDFLCAVSAASVSIPGSVVMLSPLLISISKKMSKRTFPCLRIVLNHLKVIYRYNCTKMLQMYLSQPLWKFIAFWCWRSICITIGQIMGNFHYNPIYISRVIKKNKFFAFFKCPHTMHWILNVSIYIWTHNGIYSR